jgi:hypothetical protein
MAKYLLTNNSLFCNTGIRKKSGRITGGRFEHINIQYLFCDINTPLMVEGGDGKRETTNMRDAFTSHVSPFTII